MNSYSKVELDAVYLEEDMLDYLVKNDITHKIINEWGPAGGCMEVEFIGPRMALEKMIETFWQDNELFKYIKKIKSALDTASEIRGDLEGAMTDLAACSDIDPTDWSQIDAEADRIWNDPKELRGIIGDRIFWATDNMRDKGYVKAVCVYLIEQGHRALKEAVKNLMEDYKLEEYEAKEN